MNKKEILELLIRCYGLIPKEIKHYRTDGCDGQFEVGIGWEGFGVTKNGMAMIRFAEPDGFNMAVYEILKQAKDMNLRTEFIGKNN